MLVSDAPGYYNKITIEQGLIISWCDATGRVEILPMDSRLILMLDPKRLSTMMWDYSYGRKSARVTWKDGRVSSLDGVIADTLFGKLPKYEDVNLLNDCWKELEEKEEDGAVHN